MQISQVPVANNAHDKTVFISGWTVEIWIRHNIPFNSYHDIWYVTIYCAICHH